MCVCVCVCVCQPQIRELEYAKAKEALDQEIREEEKRSWLEPTRTLLYTETGTRYAMRPDPARRLMHYATSDLDAYTSQH